MAYTQNPHMPKVRRDAADMVRRGYTPTEVGRRFGVGSSTICKWVMKAKGYGLHPIPTRSSRPHHHPHETPETLVRIIAQERLRHGRCAEAVHETLRREGHLVSLSTVKRTLDRRGLLHKRSPYKRYHPHVERPKPTHPGVLVELDTIHRMIDTKKRLYVYVAIDVYSRWVYARAYTHISGQTSLQFLLRAQAHASFRFNMIQSDHGPEFSSWFYARAEKEHRYTRIGKPNDNAHIERFNRTVQEECLDHVSNDVPSINRALRRYLRWYNTERVHLGINLKSPQEYLTEYVQAID